MKTQTASASMKTRGLLPTLGTFLLLVILLSGCAENRNEKNEKQVDEKENTEELKAVLNGMEPDDIYTLERIPGTEGEGATTVVKMSIENFEKINNSIEVLETKYTGTEGSTSYITFLDNKELNGLREKYPDIPWDSYAQTTSSDMIQMKEKNFDEIRDKLLGSYSIEKVDREKGIVFFKIEPPGFNLQKYQNEYPHIPWGDYSFNEVNSFRICESDYNTLKNDLDKMKIEKYTDHTFLVRIKDTEQTIFSPEIPHDSMSVGEDGFLIYRNFYSHSDVDFNRLGYTGGCNIGDSPSEMVFSNISDQVFDPTLFSMNLPSELAPNPVNSSDKVFYLVKLHPEKLSSLLRANATNLSPIPHEFPSYDLFSGTSPFSLIVVSTTEEEILKAKEQGIVWWYERYHPAYKMDVRPLYGGKGDGFLYPKGEQMLVTVQVTFYMPEGVNEETVAEKREELKKMAIDFEVPKHRREPPNIDRKTLISTLGVYREKDDEYFGTDYVEPREGVNVPWANFDDANTFSFLLPQFPMGNIKDLLKREDVVRADAASIRKEVIWNEGL